MSNTSAGTSGISPSVSQLNVAASDATQLGANFESWFKNVLQGLYSNTAAGLPIMMITLSLLERYLREVSMCHEEISIDRSFRDELRKVFSNALKDDEQAKAFWKVFRHGLLHQATPGTNGGWTGWIKHEPEFDAIVVRADKKEFWVCPKKFAETVIGAIERNFASFTGPGSPNHPLSRVGVSPNSGEHGTSGNAANPAMTLT